MKKFLALLLTLALLAGLTACKDTEAASTAQEQHTVTAPTNDATFVYQPDDPAATLPGGESVVLVTGPDGTESGEDAMLWQGIQTFANTYGYTAPTPRLPRVTPQTRPRPPCALPPRAAQSSWSAAATHGRGALPHAGKLP